MTSVTRATAPQLTAPEGFDGPGKNRKCTDVLFLLLLCANWYAMTMVGFVVLGYIPNDRLPPGDPRRLINGMDYLGQICAVDARTRLSNATSTGKYFTGYSYDRYETAEYRRYDVSKLPKAYFLLTGEAVCVKKCPSKTDYNAFVCKNDPDVTARMDTAQQADAAVSETSTTFYQIAGFLEVADTNCMFKMQSTGYMGYCVPDELTAAAQEEAQAAATVPAGSSALFLNTTYNDKAKPEKSVWEQFCADMFAAAGYIFGFGFGVAMVASFLYVWVMRIPGVLTLVIWGLIAAVQFFLLALFGLAYYTYDDWNCGGADTSADDFDASEDCSEAYSADRDQMQIDAMQ